MKGAWVLNERKEERCLGMPILHCFHVFFLFVLFLLRNKFLLCGAIMLLGIFITTAQALY